MNADHKGTGAGSPRQGLITTSTVASSPAVASPASSITATTTIPIHVVGRLLFLLLMGGDIAGVGARLLLLAITLLVDELILRSWL